MPMYKKGLKRCAYVKVIARELSDAIKVADHFYPHQNLAGHNKKALNHELPTSLAK